MSIVRATLGSLSQMLSVREDQIEDALSSERLVKVSLSRRGFMGVTAAVATAALTRGVGFSEIRQKAFRWTVDWSKGTTYTLAIHCDTELTFVPPHGLGTMLLRISNCTGRGAHTNLPANVKWTGGFHPRLAPRHGDIDAVMLYFDGRDYYAAAAFGRA